MNAWRIANAFKYSNKVEKDSEEKIEDNYKFKKTRRIKSQNWKMHRIQKNIGMEQRRIDEKNI